ncbi:MAG: transglycosylase domain-containing protein, partial [Nocardioides sp.]
MTAKRRATGPAVKKKPQRPGDRKRRVLKVVKILLVLGLVGAVLVAGAFFALYSATDIPDPNAEFEAQTTRVYYSGGKDEMGRFATQNRESISLDEMPATIKDAVVAAENRTFWTDRGIDPKGILRAAFSNAAGNSTQGASTITQQYVKILYLTQERSLKRKLTEAMLSLKLQQQLSKEQILEGYLNTIYFGRGAYGVQAASLAYFDKPAADLSLREAAVLASVLNNPTNLDPANGKDAKSALRERYDYTLGSMAETGSVTADEAEKAMNRLPKFPEIAAESQYGGQRGHMLKMVRDELLSLGYTDREIDGGGLQVTTTFTSAAMAAAEQGVREERPEGFDGGALHVAVATVETGTGALRGFYGGQDYLESQINWAVAGGMVGSTFKPFTLATAINEGFSLDDTFEGNSPYEFPDGLVVRNEGDGDGNDYGTAVTATTALEQSINTAFVDMSDSIPDGPAKILATAESMGVPPPKANKKYPGIPGTSRDLEADALITLGKSRVSPINMANAYATIANEGQRADVHVIEKVVDVNGETDYSFKSSNTTALPADVSSDVSYAMQQVVQEGTGRAALALGRPAAGKTGTATNDKDQVSSAWFVGFTPQLSTAVMYVRGDGDDQLDGWLPSYFGADYPASTWTNVMGKVTEGMDVEEFPEPAMLDGEAPTDGHEYTPPPSPTQAPPSRRPSPTRPTKPTDEPTPTEEPTPTPTPTETVPTITPTVPPTTAPPPPPTTLVPTTAPPPPPTATASV